MSKRDELRQQYESQIGKVMFNKFSNADHTQTTKYLKYFCSMWVTKKMENLSYGSKDIIEAVKDFELHIYLIEEKDLYHEKYKSWQTLLSVVETARNKKFDSEFNRDEHIRILYEDKNYLFLEPLTRTGSLKYGSNTKWCTSAKTDNFSFARYSKNGFLAYLIKKGEQKNSNYNKLAFFTEETQNALGGAVQIYNQIDSAIEDNLVNKNGWEYEDLSKFIFMFRVEALNRFQYRKAKNNVDKKIGLIKNLDLEELKKDLKIVTRHDGDNQDNVINMIEQVMKQMITKIENF
jgi:hypothetical protein